MTLLTARYFQDSLETPRPVASDTGWQEVRAGLACVASGYAVFLVVGLGGLLLGRMATEAAALALGRPPRRQDVEVVLTLAVFVTLLAQLVAYVLVLVGQWRCLMYASERENAKELMYVSVYCLLFGGLLHGAGVCLDGGEAYAALHEGLGRLRRLDWWSVSCLLQFGGAGGVFLSGLVFIQFLRNVSDCLHDRARGWALGLNVLAAGLLLGGSIGAVLCFSRLEGRPDVFGWLAAAWGIWFVWHLLGVTGVRRRLEEHEHAANDGPRETVVT